MNLTIDVVIPLHNDEKFIALAIKSVLEQTYPINKVYVVNDRSSDGSLDAVKACQQDDPRIILLENAGFERSAARNTGIRASNSEYVAFLDSDDYWHPEKLERQVLKIKQNPECEFIYCNYLMIGASGEYLSRSHVLSACLRGNVFDELILENRISGSSSAVLCKKYLFDRVGYFDESLKYGEDWEMWLRLAEVTKFDYIEDDMVYIRTRHQNPIEDNYFCRNYKRTQHISVWSRWPQTASRNRQIIMRLSGYFRYPHLRPNLSLKGKLKRIETLKKRLAKNLDPLLMRKTFSTSKNGVYFLLLKNYVRYLPIVLIQKKNLFNHRVRKLLSIIRRSPTILANKIQAYLAKKYIWLGPLKRDIYTSLGVSRK